MSSKRILVIGGTGAQGFAVVQALLKASFTVRVLSRNPDAPSVVSAFAGLPVEFAKGSFMDFEVVKSALQDCYGVYVNTDGKFAQQPFDNLSRYVVQMLIRSGFSVNEQDELWAGVRILKSQRPSRPFAITCTGASTITFSTRDLTPSMGHITPSKFNQLRLRIPADI